MVAMSPFLSLSNRLLPVPGHQRHRRLAPRWPRACHRPWQSCRIHVIPAPGIIT